MIAMASHQPGDSAAINRDGPRMLYVQIAETLASEVQDRYQPGDRLPTEYELTRRFGVNRHTLRHAVDLLVARGLLVRRQGLGTFVLAPLVAYPLHSQARFSDNLAAAGHSRESTRLSVAAEPAPAEVAAALRLQVGNTAWRLETLRAVDGRPTTIITHWLPLELFPDLAGTYQGGSLHSLLRTRYGVQPRRASTMVGAQPADPVDARLLELDAGAPVLRLRTLNVDDDRGVPIEYSIGRIRADRFELLIDHAEDVR